MVSHAAVPGLPVRKRNAPEQYDDLHDQWWEPRGPFAMLAWLAEHRASLVPPATRPDALLLDLACGGGLLAPHLSGYRHVGLDLSPTAVRVAARHGVTPVRGDVTRLPFADGVADVVVAGEILEHVPDPAVVIAEAARVLRPGGTLVFDTIARTPLARIGAITLAERLPGGPPRRLHDPALLVGRRALVDACARHGVPVTLQGARPSAWQWVAWAAHRRDSVDMRVTRSTAILFTGIGHKTVVGAPEGREGG